ncbi:MAG TPA: multicopper oxidase domain-containing protein [Acidimicrobiia bacterium]|nr:multicopper oxidase domain-containing protein [Acidimicrobiia bacterium]
MTTRPNETGDRSTTATLDKLLIIVAVMGAAFAIMAAVVAIRGGGTAGAVQAAQQTGHLTLTEFAIDGEFEFAPGPLVLEVTNEGTQMHNLTLEEGPATADLNIGDSASLDVGEMGEGTYLVFCSIPGHRAAGMEASLVITPSGSPDQTEAHEDTEADWAEMDRLMTESILAFPAETEGKGNQLLQPEILADGTKEFHLTAAITKWEVSPGKLVDAWTYNGMVPAPMIRVDVGDRVRVVLDNQLPMGTDIHWHGVKVPNNMDGVAPITQPLVESGETFVYEFTTRESAIAMYHAHHHAQMQVPNGLFGAFIVGETPIPDGQTVSGVEIPRNLEIAQEIPMVLNDAGVIGLSLNAKSFPATEPYTGKVGDWVVVHYFNEGVLVHPMHQHQFPQLVFAKDGIPLDHPYWADTVPVAPGERYSVLFQLEDPGVWVWHCHILNHVESETGMFGMVTAWIVEE